MKKEWNHNIHYHEYLLKQKPAHFSSALEIGSGAGLFSSRLAAEFDSVISMEPDVEALDHARALYKDLENITYLKEGFLDYDFGNRKFDYICAIASVHHMDYGKALEKMKELLNPGGKVVILGLYRESSLIDLLTSLAAIIPNLIRNRPLKHNASSYEFVTATPPLSIGEMMEENRRILKSFKFRRHLYWRYSLIYTERNNSPK